LIEVFADTTIFVSHCMVGDESLIKLLENYSVYTSPNVIEESFYKSLYLKTEDLLGKSGKYLLKEHYIKEKQEYEPIFEYYSTFIRELVDNNSIILLPLTSEILFDSIKISWKYSLLPNDALIAATCKHYGIKKIATFDDDFKRVDFLEAVEI